MNKKFYTYEEILLALREEYLKNRELLNKLKRYIYIENDSWVESCDIKPQFQQKNNEYYMQYPTKELAIYFSILERISFIKKTYEELFGCSRDRLITYNIKSKEDNSFGLEEKVRGPLVWFDPKITITDQKAFDNLAYEIFNSEFMNLQSERFYSMFGFNLRVNANQIYLGCYDHWISYDPNKDTIDVKNIKHSSDISLLIHATIPECYLNDRVKELINKNIPNNKQITIEEEHFGKTVTLGIVDTNKGIKLRKLKK